MMLFRRSVAMFSVGAHAPCFGCGALRAASTAPRHGHVRPAAQHGRGRDNRGAAAPEPSDPFPVDYSTVAAEVATTLNQLKRAAGQAKGDVDLQRKSKQRALSILNHAEINIEEPNEKTVALTLNAAAFFGADPDTPVVRQAVMWAKENVAGCEPQHVALFAHSIVALNFFRRRDFLSEEIAPRMLQVMDETTPVEMAMVAQAFARAGVVSEPLVQAIMKRTKQVGVAIRLSEFTTLFESLLQLTTQCFGPGGEAQLGPLLESLYAPITQQLPKAFSNTAAKVAFIVSSIPPPAASEQPQDELGPDATRQSMMQALFKRVEEVSRHLTAEEGVVVVRALHAFHKTEAAVPTGCIQRVMNRLLEPRVESKLEMDDVCAIVTACEDMKYRHRDTDAFLKALMPKVRRAVSKGVAAETIRNAKKLLRIVHALAALSMESHGIQELVLEQLMQPATLSALSGSDVAQVLNAYKGTKLLEEAVSLMAADVARVLPSCSTADVVTIFVVTRSLNASKTPVVASLRRDVNNASLQHVPSMSRPQILRCLRLLVDNDAMQPEPVDKGFFAALMVRAQAVLPECSAGFAAQVFEIFAASGELSPNVQAALVERCSAVAPSMSPAAVTCCLCGVLAYGTFGDLSRMGHGEALRQRVLARLPAVVPKFNREDTEVALQALPALFPAQDGLASRDAIDLRLRLQEHHRSLKD